MKLIWLLQSLALAQNVAMLKNQAFQQLGRDLTVWHGDEELVEVTVSSEYDTIMTKQVCRK